MCNENKGDDQFPGYREADLHLCFCIFKNWFSHDPAHRPGSYVVGAHWNGLGLLKGF